MGRQLRFFTAKEDEMAFFEYITDKGYIILEKKGKLFSALEVNNSEEYKFYITFNDARIINMGNYIDEAKSDVVEFMRCIFRNKNVIDYGRIWAELKPQYSGDNEIVKSEKLSVLYNCMAKYIKNNMKLSKCKAFYIADNAYAGYKEKRIVMSSNPTHLIRPVEFD